MRILVDGRRSTKSHEQTRIPTGAQASSLAYFATETVALQVTIVSIDYGQSTLYESHQILFAGNVPAFENLADLSALPASGFTVIAMPMKIAGGSGGPLRIAAIVD
jgi:kynurenine formamidase